jgi:hypothetical protein
MTTTTPTISAITDAKLDELGAEISAAAAELDAVMPALIAAVRRARAAEARFYGMGAEAGFPEDDQLGTSWETFHERVGFDRLDRCQTVISPAGWSDDLLEWAAEVTDL